MVSRRLNPALPDYEIRKLLRKQQETQAAVERARADTVTSQPPTNPASLVIDPTNPHLYIYTSPSLVIDGHLIDLPSSSLAVADPTSPGRVIFPNINI